jgi:hypothetical protein
MGPIPTPADEPTENARRASPYGDDLAALVELDVEPIARRRGGDGRHALNGRCRRGREAARRPSTAGPPAQKPGLAAAAGFGAHGRDPGRRQLCTGQATDPDRGPARRTDRGRAALPRAHRRDSRRPESSASGQPGARTTAGCADASRPHRDPDADVRCRRRDDVDGDDRCALLPAARAAGDDRIGQPAGAGDRSRYTLIAFLALAMGIQNATARRLAVPDLTTTVLTLTLTGIAADSRLGGGSGANTPRRVLAVAAMLLGAIVGAALLREGSAVAPLTLAVAIPVVVSALARRGRARATAIAEH